MQFANSLALLVLATAGATEDYEMPLNSMCKFIGGCENRIQVKSLFSVDGVVLYAIDGNMVAAKLGNGDYAIIHGDESSPVIDKTSDPNSFLASLRTVGFKKDMVWLNPNEEAEKMPEQTIRPWKYRKMHGLCGASDETLGLNIFGGSFLLSLLTAIFMRSPLKSLIITAMGVIGVYWGLMVIAGGGPAVISGVLWYAVISFVAMRRQKKPA